ncbi:MAG: FAD-dependent oxidoreductase, partial [Verrucomicrobiaceae bacterium]
MTPPIHNVTVLGGGSAGFIAALTLKRKIPALNVTVVRSPDIGVIGVGEGTTPYFPLHLFQYLGLDPRQFYREAQPTWKLGIRFLWGARPDFYYTFTNQFDSRWNDLSRSHGYYCEEDCGSVDLATALISSGKAFPRRFDGWPDFQLNYAFHIENRRLVEYLEARCRECGVTIIDGTVQRVEHWPGGNVAGLLLKEGGRCSGDLIIDASGFRSELLGRTLEEPFVSYDKALFCDKAVIGGWARTDEPIFAYTTAETMDAGWC